MPCLAHSWQPESNVTLREQFSGVLLATHVPRLWPYCLSIRDQRAIYPRGHCHDQKKGNPACPFSYGRELNCMNLPNTNEEIFKRTKMNDAADTGECTSSFLLSSLACCYVENYSREVDFYIVKRKNRML